jgi:class 3 adenylate cyclase/alpha-beta hydrolase superfamily lysophospholipase
VTDVPQTLYAPTADGAQIAYQVLGDGPLDLVFVESVGSHVELAWDVARFARVYRRLASFSRMIRFDSRGSGLSDPFPLSARPSLEDRTRDMLTVLDAAGTEQAAVVANAAGGHVAMFFAATYPNRTSALVLDGCWACLARAADFPLGVPADVLDRLFSNLDAAQGPAGPSALRSLAPSALRDDPEFVAQYVRYDRSRNNPATSRATAHLAMFGDVRAALPAIQAPTLVLCRSDDRQAGKPHGVYLAERIRGAKLVELPGEDTMMFVGDSDADLDEIEEFLTGARQAPATDRVLATVLFTDIVGSTERAGALGDRKWRELLDSHDRAVRRQLERFRGREVNTAGDGFLATFDGPGRAIECACAIRDALRGLGIDVRAGLHTGEIEVRGADVAGMAVHIGSRVAASAGPGEVIVSGAVPPLVVGSGISFEDRGEHELKGVPGAWHLYSVTA